MAGGGEVRGGASGGGGVVQVKESSSGIPGRKLFRLQVICYRRRSAKASHNTS